MQKLLLWMKSSVSHPNIMRFLGVTESNGIILSVSEYCSKGVLRDVLLNDNYKLDDHFKFSLSSDVADGLKYLHRMNIVHGSLSTTTCFIDARWNVLIADWEYTHMTNLQPPHSIAQVVAIDYLQDDRDENVRMQYVMAPEMVRRAQFRPTKPCDVYSFRLVINNSTATGQAKAKQLSFLCCRKQILRDEVFGVT
ncbi:hypothetical protein LSAT2_021920 [Lamellibrachia satsuma]|nr:hypothetical protein LSAT2_021920 [Lamellibrachia satsuma]